MTPAEIENLHKTDYQTRFDMMYKCNADDYNALHTSHLIPTNIKIDVELFRNTMTKYDQFFRDWSKNRPEMLGIRQGLPLVNLTGNHDDVIDHSIGPLDYYNNNHPDNQLHEADITTPTEILAESCFDPLDDIKPYLVRSSILKWHPGANFVPHVDLGVPTAHFRLWGTDNPESIKVRFENENSQFVEIENVEPGRLYIIDTAKLHDAVCIGTMGYQFFIAVMATSYDLLNRIKIK